MFTYQHLTKSFFHTLLLFFTAIAITSCGGREKVDSDAASMGLNQPVKENTKPRDERFLIQAAEFDYEQIMIGKLARQRATSEDVRSFATMMEEAHRNTKSELGSMGIVKSIAVPSAPTKAAYDSYDKLNALSIEEFDEAYLVRVIESHNDAIAMFENCTNASHDPDVKAIASKRLPELRNHLSKAMELDAVFSPLSEVVK